MTAIPFGDRALLLEVNGVREAHRLAADVAAMAAMAAAAEAAEAAVAAVSAAAPADAVAEEAGGRAFPEGVVVEEVVVGHRCVVVVLAGRWGQFDEAAEVLGDLARRGAPGSGGDGGAAVGGAAVGGTAVGGTAADGPIELPVTFDGADLEEVADSCGASVPEVVDLMCDAELEVAFVGFAPGFPYLVGLDDRLASLVRRSTPRAVVPAGSVAVAGGFAGVYPRASPGGWNLLGRTAVRLFDPDRPPYALFRPGDRIRFVDDHLGDRTDGEPPRGGRGHTDRAVAGRAPLAAAGPRSLEVLEPGFLTLIQDTGRIGVAATGIPRAGAADPDALGLANRLVGNPVDAAALEITGAGPTLRCSEGAHVTVVGAGSGATRLTVDGRPYPDGVVVPVAGGQVVAVGRVTAGVRAYLAVAGGLATPSVFGSRSSDVLSGLGPGRLRAGDTLEIGPRGRPRGLLGPRDTPGTGPVRLRVVPGPHRVGDSDRSGRSKRSLPAPRDRLLTVRWSVGPDSDRMGVRLEPAPGEEKGHGGADLISRAVDSTPMVTGAVQLPPDGEPIVLLPDHATVGGYPVVACVITADLGRLGQLAAGDEVSFVAVGVGEARRAAERETVRAAARVTGWFPTATAT